MNRLQSVATAFAPAKVNLTLHVTGRRDDGYHLLDSLVVFAGVGDRLRFAPAQTTTLTIGGPFAAGVPTDGTNLILRAAALMDGPMVAIHLDKRLPPASGIGGGSADAAATLRALAEMGGRARPDFDAAVLRIGADLPVCLAGRPCRMQGIGERLSPAPALPPAWLVLVNPGVPVPTGAVFAALQGRYGPGMANLPDRFDDVQALARWLATQRNDLQAPALALAPPVAEALAALSAQRDCLLARMSGSGGTCFGLFADEPKAQAAAAGIISAERQWWAAAASIRA
ncbi:MAG: 4-(cytidine 5'-diphospho)-2-C-methyl-D-erythritol kinase [Gemmobacter sp.]